jgi:hypothetical protein
MNPSDITALRLINQQIAATRFKTPKELQTTAFSGRLRWQTGKSADCGNEL